jgi:hypothetical protein
MAEQGGFEMRLIITAIIASIFLAPAQAAFIDNGIFTTDTVSGLDWLDLSVTENMTMVDALSTNSGWQFATNAEVEDIFWQLFDGYFDNLPSGASHDEFPSYADQREDVDAFGALFGFTEISGEKDSLGLYIDEDGFVRAMGTAIGILDESLILGLDFTGDYSDQYESTADTLYGTYLVQSSVVPVPAAAWLFGSALGFLGWIKRRNLH